MSYIVIYKTDIITQNTTVDRDGYTSIIFRNQGNTNAFVAGGVIISPGDSLKLRNDPGQIIENSFLIQFESKIGNLAVIRTYYKEREGK